MRTITAAVASAPAIAAAVGAAALFGASMPVAKALVADVHPVVLAALLYLGSGLGLLAIRAPAWLRPGGTGLAPRDWPWLAGAIVFGGVLGPIALMLGLVRTSGASASLLLNLEAVLTALIAWVVFRENADRRIVLGMALIVAGGVALAWPTDAYGAHDAIGAALVAAACLCWAITTISRARCRPGTRRSSQAPRGSSRARSTLQSDLRSAAICRRLRPRPPRSRSASSATA